ncbi:MAG TPA: hypothetical protein VHK69_00155 [Chitinophagaceae bacterium]|nr:hypothetical protein [Chitinophagaceae bacterium]
MPLRKNLLLLFLLFSLHAAAQDSTYLRVHFLYGSRPLKPYKNAEPKWFGGMLGGHVGIEGDSGRILNFVPRGKFHWFAKKKNPHSAFAEHNYPDFYAILGGPGDTVKRAVVTIPVSTQQKQLFDSIASAYLRQTPYDYALFGMRCGAAAYEILGQLQILPSYSYGKTYRKIFYPKKLRKRLFRKAAANGWAVQRTQGSARRKWERD